jgi:hypothetical protein
MHYNKFGLIRQTANQLREDILQSPSGRHLLHGNPCAGRAVQEPLEVETCKLIMRVLADMGYKRRQ